MDTCSDPVIADGMLPKFGAVFHDIYCPPAELERIAIPSEGPCAAAMPWHAHTNTATIWTIVTRDVTRILGCAIYAVVDGKLITMAQRRGLS